MTTSATTPTQAEQPVTRIGGGPTRSVTAASWTALGALLLRFRPGQPHLGEVACNVADLGIELGERDLEGVGHDELLPLILYMSITALMLCVSITGVNNPSTAPHFAATASISTSMPGSARPATISRVEAG